MNCKAQTIFEVMVAILLTAWQLHWFLAYMTHTQSFLYQSKAKVNVYQTFKNYPDLRKNLSPEGVRNLEMYLQQDLQRLRIAKITIQKKHDKYIL